MALAPAQTPHEQRWFKVAFFLHVLAAVFSAGYLATDEHFQILEFLNFKWGLSSASDLAVEFGLRARPFIQVAFYALVAAPFRALGVTDGFMLAIILRLASAMVGLVALMHLVHTARVQNWIKNHTLALWMAPLAALLWFMPALHARTSQENLGGAMLVLGLCFGLRARSDFLHLRDLTLAGALVWAAAEVRFQMLAVAGPVFALLLFYTFTVSGTRTNLRSGVRGRATLALLSGAGLSFIFARVADRWGYGEWTFPFLNYFQYNFVDQRLLTKVPLVPWDYYRSVATETWPLLGPLVLALFTLGWIKRPWHPLSLATAPLFLVHSLIAYKEYRFILPIAHFAPVMIPFALDQLGGRFTVSAPRWALWGWALLGWNLIALAVTTLTPARAALRISETIAREALKNPERPFVVVTPDHDEPFRALGLMMNFYRPKNLIERIDQPLEDLGALRTPGQALWVLTRRESSTRWAPELALRCEKVIQTPPAPIVDILDRTTSLHRWIPPGRVGRSILWRCDS